MRRAAVVVACLVVLSGCSFISDGANEAGSQSTPPVETEPAPDSPTPADGPGTSTATGTNAESDGPGPTPTATRTPTPAPRHPWAGEVVTVGVVDEMPGPRDFVPMVREAAATWNGTGVAGGTVRFRVVRGSADADLTLTVQPTVETCGDDAATDTFRYCVPRVTPGSDATQSGTLAGRYDNETFRRIATGSFALLVGDDPEATQFLPVEDPAYADPWPAAHPVVVGVTNEGNESRNVTGLVRQALAWWDDRPRSQKDYTTEFVVRPDASAPDLTVELVDEIGTCGVENDTLIVGCADLLDANDLADDPTVEVKAGYTDESTVRILKHEFGHIYGRSHGEQPLPLMNETTPVDTWPQPNATERALPWQNSTLSVYLDAEGSVDAAGAWNDIEPALGYFEDGADGWLEERVTFVRTRNRTAADIEITVADTGACGYDNGGVCDIFVAGIDPDGDGAFERYTNATMTVTVSGDTERAWFAGYGLASALGAASESDLPPPLRDVDNADERWWE